MIWHLQKKKFPFSMRDNIDWSHLPKQENWKCRGEREDNEQTRGRGSHKISSILRMLKLVLPVVLWLCSGPHRCWGSCTTASSSSTFQKGIHLFSHVQMCYNILPGSRLGGNNSQVTWNNTPLWFRGLQDESEACFSMINKGAAVFLPKALQMLFLP